MSEDIYQSPESNLESGAGVLASPTMAELLFKFKGRINRQRYWFGMLGMYAVVIVAFVILGAVLPDEAIGVAVVVVYIPMIWVALALQIKRWHDRDKSGWWVLIAFIPIIGGIWALVENGFLKGDEGVNRFGQPCI